MTILECCRAEVITASPEATAHEVARLMGESGVGSVVITGADDCPLGIITDRDLVLRVLAESLDPKKVRAKDIMTGDLLVVEDGTGIYEAVRCARAEGVTTPAHRGLRRKAGGDTHRRRYRPPSRRRAPLRDRYHTGRVSLIPGSVPED